MLVSGQLCNNRGSVQSILNYLLTFKNLGDVGVSKLLHVSDLSVHSLIRLHARRVFLADQLESDLQIN